MPAAQPPFSTAPNEKVKFKGGPANSCWHITEVVSKQTDTDININKIDDAKQLKQQTSQDKTLLLCIYIYTAVVLLIPYLFFNWAFYVCI